MTREEAIEVIEQDIPCEYDTDLIEALEMAIAALKAEPCEDAVKRESVIEVLDWHEHEKCEIENYIREIAEDIKALPSVQPERAKDIPKPITIENGFVKCGGCEKYIRFPIADRYSYCPECGQAILWMDMSRFEKANKIVVPAIKSKMEDVSK